MVLRTEPLNFSQTLALKKLEETGDYNFWKGARARSNADIMAHPKDIEKLIQLLNDQKIHHTIMVDDVEKYVLRFMKYYHKTMILSKWCKMILNLNPNCFFQAFCRDRNSRHHQKQSWLQETRLAGLLQL